jgi:hypothetical protein
MSATRADTSHAGPQHDHRQGHQQQAAFEADRMGDAQGPGRRSAGGR